MRRMLNEGNRVHNLVVKSMDATAVSLPSESTFAYTLNDNIVFVLGYIAANLFAPATYGQSLEAIAW